MSFIFEHGGPLMGVTCAHFEEDASFITGLGLQFEKVSVVIRAVPEDDTLSCSIGDLVAESDESLLDVSNNQTWAKSLSRHLRWGWRMTNQQGYTDGVRLEFFSPRDCESICIDLVVAASAIQVVERKQNC